MRILKDNWKMRPYYICWMQELRHRDSLCTILSAVAVDYISPIDFNESFVDAKAYYFLTSHKKTFSLVLYVTTNFGICILASLIELLLTYCIPHM